MKTCDTKTIPYTIRSQSSRTPCPHGMKATCDNCGIKNPRVVHVGSWMERDCPFFVEDKVGQKVVVCDFIPGTFTVYESR